MSELTFRVAQDADAEAIAQIVNDAYRPQEGAGGWTHEAHLVRGDRISPGQVRELVRTSSVIVGHAGQSIVCSAHIAIDHGAAHIGMLAVRPSLQGAGIGKAVLDHAERYAAEVLGAADIVLFVLKDRPELIAFYVRRGYEQTGDYRAYPTGLGVGTPVSEGLQLEVLRKRANHSLQARRP